MASKDDDLAKIAAYVKGKLEADETQELEARLAQDSALRILVESARKWQAELRAREWADVSSAVHGLLSRQLQEVKASLKDRRKRGITTFDSKFLPVPEGVRPATVDTRRIKISILDAQLDISLYPVSTGSYELIGQLIDWNTEASLTVVLDNPHTKLTADMNQFYLFQFPRVPTGKYILKIKSSRSILAVFDLEI